MFRVERVQRDEIILENGKDAPVGRPTQHILPIPCEHGEGDQHGKQYRYCFDIHRQENQTESVDNTAESGRPSCEAMVSETRAEVNLCRRARANSRVGA